MLKIEFTDRRHEPTWVVSKSFSIGSADDNNLVINDPSVSPQHAKLVFQNGAFTLKDINSTEGTFVNGKKIVKQLVACNDVIRFGDVELNIVDPLDSDKARGGTYWSLIASSNWLAGQEFPIQSVGDRPVVIGRGKNCDITFPGTHLSRQHVEVTLNSDHIILKDLGSANGTFINDKRIHEGIARPGDSVRLDVYNFKLFGPGFNLPKSATATTIPIVDLEGIELKEEDEGSPEWKIPPTSPGNRIEPETSQNSAAMIILSLSMLLGLVGLTYYLFFL